jgi:predicted nucleotidyltransferase
MYGTHVATSDLDYKSIFIPRAEDILLQRARHNISTTTKVVQDSKNTAQDVDTEAFALHEWMKLLLEGQTMALDMLFAPPDFILETSPIWKEIKALKA